MNQKKKMAIILASILALMLVGAAVASKIIASDPYRLPSVKYRPTETPVVTAEPTAEPTPEPTAEPTAEPTEEPVVEPTEVPVVEPTEEPVVEPTEEPVVEPTEVPVVEPTEEPVVEPTEEPVVEPTEEPVIEPTEEPVIEPTEEPIVEPTEEPVAEPTEEPVVEPTEEPVIEPTEEPAIEPTEEPVTEPTEEPVIEPTEEPAIEPTEEPVTEPTAEPTAEPVETPKPYDGPIAVGNAEVHAAPDADSPVVFTVPNGAAIKVFSTEGDWAKVEAHGFSGYLHRDHVRGVAFAQPAATPVPEQPENITENDLPDNARLLGVIQDKLSAERSVSVYVSYDGEYVTFGDTVTLYAVLHGYEDTVYTLQWQSSPDNASWADISGAVSASYAVTVTEANYTDYYRVAVTINGVIVADELLAEAAK